FCWSSPPPQPVAISHGRRPAEREAMRLKAAGVRSISRLLAQVEPQQLRSPQNRSVCGPQSAIVVTTLPPPQRDVVRCRKPQVRRDRPTPHRSGRVIAQQASEVLGQACWRLPELQVPQAPLPVLLHGPQAVPQQNQETSPLTGPSKSAGGSADSLRAMSAPLSEGF